MTVKPGMNWRRFRRSHQAPKLVSASTNRKVSTRLTTPGRPAYVRDTGATALVGSSQILVDAVQPRRSTPAIKGSPRTMRNSPSQTAQPSSVVNQDFIGGCSVQDRYRARRSGY